MPEFSRIKSFLKTSITIGVLMLAPSTILAQENTDNSKVLATVNGVEITQREFALAEVEMLEQFAQVPTEQRKAAILNALIDIKLLATAALEEGLEESEGFKARMAYHRSRWLHNEIFSEKALKVITDEELKARYEVEIKTFPQEVEVRARHILVEKEETAKEIIVELDGGADFIELAKAKSTGPSGPQGGDLGYFGRGQMVPEFETAAFALESGKYTKEAVKSQFGWHIIFKEDQRDREPPSFDQVKDQVRQTVAREKYFKLTQDARAKYKVEVLDEDLEKRIQSLQQ